MTSLKNPNELFLKLIDLREKLNIDLISNDFLIATTPISEIEIQLESPEGITVSAGEIDSVLEGSLLSYKGVLAIVYIADTAKPEWYLKDNNLLRRFKKGTEEEKSPKFHFSWCRTLEDMKTKKRYDRYVLLRNKSNKFKVYSKEDRYSSPQEVDELVRLFPCKFCLSGDLPFTKEKTGYKGYSKKWPQEQKRTAVEEFSIGEFLDENQGVFNTIKYSQSIREKTKYTDQNVPINDYTSSFTEISRKLRADKSWICSKCKVDMNQKKEGLHVHHRNGIKNDNAARNLQVLCALCHKGIDSFHSGMHVKSSIENFILNNRPIP